MAKNVQIKVSIDTTDGVKSIGDLNKEISTTLTTLGDMEEASALIGEKLRSVEVGTAEYEKLRKELINVNTEIKNQELAMEALDHEQVASEMKSVVGGLTDMAGGMALVGVSGGKMEEVVQTFAKVEGASKIATGAMEGYSSMMKLQGTIAGKLAAAQNFLAAAQLKGGVTSKLAAVGMKVLNAVMSANPVFLIIAGIAALVGALAWFMSSTDDAAEKNEAFNKTFEKQLELQERAAAANKKHGDQRLELAAAMGESEEQLHKIRLDNLAQEEADRKKSITSYSEGIKKQREIYKDALDEGDEELATQIKGEIAANRKKYKDLIAQNGDYNHKKTIEDLKYQSHLDEVNKKEVEDAEKKNQENASNYRKWIENRIKATRLLEDLNQELDGDEISANDIKYARLIEDTKTNEALKQSEKEAIITKYELLRQQKEDKIIAAREKKLVDAEIKLQNNLNAIRDGELAELESINEEIYQNSLTAQEQEIIAVQDKFFRLKELAIKHGEDVTAITEEEERQKQEIRDKYADIQKENEERATQEKMAAISNAATSLASVVQESLNGSFDSINAAFATLNDSLFNEDTGLFAKMKNGSLNAMEAVAIGVETALAIVGSVIDAQEEAAAAARDDRFAGDSEALNAQLANREISQKQFDAKMRLLEQKKEQEELAAKRKAFKQKKTMAIVEAVMGTAQGVISGLANAFPLNIIMAALAGAMGAAQIGVIASQKFTGNRGGVVPGSGPGHIDSVDAYLAPGEMVINSESAAMFPQTLSALNEAGGGISLAPELPVGTTENSNNNSTFQQNNNNTVKAYVVETEITDSQKRIDRVERSAEF
jgi:hypothetical protein